MNKKYNQAPQPTVFLTNYPDISIIMNVLVIDVPDAWGMILYRPWDTTLGGIFTYEFLLCA
jgi:hypothetical protein